MAEEDPLVIDWRPVPPQNVKRAKTQCEDELLDKLGACRKQFVVHPFIKMEPFQRAKTHAVIDYSSNRDRNVNTSTSNNSRVLSPFKEGPNSGHNVAGRRLLMESRRGPRNMFFSPLKQSGPKITAIEVETIYSNQKRRARSDQDGRLERVFNTWRALECRASLNDKLLNRQDDRLEICNTPEKSMQRKLSSEKKQEKSEQTRVIQETDLMVKKMSFWRHLKIMSETIQTFSRDVTQLRESSRTEMRVYVCSTPDLIEEREMMWSVTKPEIERVCHRYGMTCHFVDLRLGADTLAGDPDAIKVIQHEIQKCRRLSLGVAFLALLGSELDVSPVPLYISTETYELIRGIVLKFNLQGLELFDEFYRLDSNNIPPVYNLQIGPHLEETMEFRREIDLIDRISTLLQDACTVGIKVGLMDNTVLQRLNMSVTQLELEEGLLRLPNPERHGLCVIVDRGSQPSDPRKPFANQTSHSIHTVKNSIKNFFYENCPKNLLQVIQSGTKGKGYLRHLHDTVTVRLVELLEESVAESKFDIRYYIGPISEQIHHIKMSRLLYRSFFGRDETEKEFRQAMHKTFNLQCPIAVRGRKGSGKSTLMAKLARQFQLWTNHSCKIIVRYIGTSPESCFIFALLLNLCHQISSMFSLPALTVEDKFSSNRLAKAWLERLEAVSGKVTTKEPLVILLDAVDELDKTESDDEKIFNWIPQKLPKGIILVYSSTVSIETIPSNVFALSCLGEKEVEEISVKELRLTLRKITKDQQLELQKRLIEEPTVVLMKTILASLRSWPSTYLPETGCGTHPYTEYLDFIESKVGPNVARYGFCFLALSRYGMTEKELTENLIKNESFVSGCIVEESDNGRGYLRGLSVNLRVGKFVFFTQDLTTEYKSDGQTVLLFRNSDFKRMILSRYGYEDFVLTLHRQLATYYQTQTRDLLLTGRTSSTSLVQKMHQLNLRMVRSVSYHFCRSHPLLPPAGDLVKKNLFCNMNWFLDRALPGTVHELLREFEDAIKTFEDQELEYFSEVVLSSKEAIIHDPFHIFVILADSLSKAPVTYTSLRAVSQQAQECLKRTDVLQLLPKHKGCLHLGTLLKKNFEFNGVPVYVCRDQKHILIQKETIVEVIDLHYGNMVTTFKYSEHFGVAEERDQRAYLYTGTELKVWNIVTNVVEQEVSVNFKCHINMECLSSRNLVIQTNDVISCFDLTNETANTSMSFESRPVAFKLSADGSRCFVLFNDESPCLKALEVPSLKPLEDRHYCYMGACVQTQPLLVTDDDRFVVLCFQHKTLIIDASTVNTSYIIGEENVCFVHSALTRCNEHVILSDSLSLITVWALRSGEKVCAFHPKVNIPKVETHTEQSDSYISNLVVSEDDHFMCVSLNSGQCVVLHVPTQSQTLVIQAHPNPIQFMVFLTDKKHFQHLLTCSITGVVKIWNLQDVLKESREATFPFIQDGDLLAEENRKLNRTSYYKLYTQKKADKTFLNGADVCGFFESVPDESFVSIRQRLYNPDSRLKWLSSKSLMDCRQVDICLLGGHRALIATSVKGVGIAIWATVTCTLQKFIKIKETKLISNLSFLKDDAYLLVKLKDISTIDDSFGIQVLSTDTGQEMWRMESILNCAFRNSEINITVVEQTCRDSHVKLSCYRMCPSPMKVWSSLVALKPKVVKESMFWQKDDLNMFGHLRDRSTELWLITVDILETFSADSHNHDHMTSIASPRVFRFPVSCLHADFRKDQIFLIMNDLQVILFGVLSGFVTKKFKMKTITVEQINPAVSLASVYSAGRSNKMCASERSLTLEVSPGGKFVLMALRNMVEIWSLTSYRKKSQFKVTPGQLASVGISADDCSVVTGSTLGSVQVWRVETGEMMCSFPALCLVQDVMVSTDGTEVVAVARDTDESRAMVLAVKTPRQLLAES